MKVNSVKVMVLRKLQENGVDFSKDYFAQPESKLSMIREACRDLITARVQTQKLWAERSGNRSTIPCRT